MLSVEDSVHGIKYIWPLDDCGRLVNLGEVSELQIQYRPLCRYAADQLQHMLTDQAHAIYLRGSVSIGAAIPHYSDLDLFVVASGALEVSELSLEI